MAMTLIIDLFFMTARNIAFRTLSLSVKVLVLGTCRVQASDQGENDETNVY